MKRLSHRRLAEGEVTGHAHVADAPDAEVFAENDESVERRLHVPNGTNITHEEHATRTLPPGNFVIDRQKEFDPFAQAVRNISD